MGGHAEIRTSLGQDSVRQPAHPRRAFGLSAGLGKKEVALRAQLCRKWLAGNAVAQTQSLGRRVGLGRSTITGKWPGVTGCALVRDYFG